MSANKSEDEYSSRKSYEDVDSPRKRLRMDNSTRKSWSLIDRRTDHEVLQEMGVSILDPDEDTSNESNIMIHHKPAKRKHNIENVNPNVNASPRKSPKRASGHSSARGRSPRSGDKVKPLTETQVESMQSNYLVDEETPLAQVTANLQYNATHRRSNTPPSSSVDELSTCSGWQCTGADSFLTLSDEVMLSVFRWLPKRTLAHCMLVCKRWYQVACDETLWQRLDLGNKTLAKNALGRILDRKPVIVRLASSEIGEWHPSSPQPSRIQYLDLSMSTLDLITLNNLLQACPLLKKLSLESVSLDDTSCQLIGNCSLLETLNLTMAQGVSAIGLEYILKGCENIQSLNVSWCNLTEDALQVLVKHLPQKLLRLNIAGMRILTDDMCSALCSRCPRLQELDVSDCSRLGTAALAAFIPLTHLHHLAISRCYLLPTPALAKLNGMVSLQYLDVFGMLQQSSLSALRATLPSIQINQFMFSAISRPTVGTRRTSVWGLRTRD